MENFGYYRGYIQQLGRACRRPPRRRRRSQLPLWVVGSSNPMFSRRCRAWHGLPAANVFPVSSCRSDPLTSPRLVYVYAAQLLATLLGYNPYNSNLDLKINQEASKQAEGELRDMAPAPANVAQNGEADGGGDQPEPAADEASGEGRHSSSTTWRGPKRARFLAGVVPGTMHAREGGRGGAGTAMRWRGSGWYTST